MWGQVLAVAFTPDGALAIATTQTDVSATLDVRQVTTGICDHVKQDRYAQEKFASYFPDMDVPAPCQ